MTKRATEREIQAGDRVVPIFGAGAFFAGESAYWSKAFYLVTPGIIDGVLTLIVVDDEGDPWEVCENGIAQFRAYEGSATPPSPALIVQTWESDATFDATVRGGEG